MDNNATQTKKNPVVLVLSLVIALLLVLVFWLVSKPIDLPPASGELDYLLSVSTQGEPLPYTPSGEPWTRCAPGKCNINLTETDLSMLKRMGVNGFLIAQKTSNQNTQKAAGVKLPFIASAHAGDGFCPIIGYMLIHGGSTPVFLYDQSDDDCPPV